jgi:hypothetical protein
MGPIFCQCRLLWTLLTSWSSRRQVGRASSLVKDRNAPQHHRGHTAVKSETSVCRRQERFMEGELDGLLRHKARLSRIAPLRRGGRAHGGLQLSNPPTETAHWTGSMMTNAIGISVSTVQRIRPVNGSSRQVRQFQALQRPGLRRQVARGCRLYVDPRPHRALGQRNKSNSALDRTQPGLR